MHHRNPYKDPIDFISLAQSYPPLEQFLIKPKLVIDFRNAEAQRRLTEALLLRDFRLNLCLPDNRLCPPVPNRLNYILWIQDLMKETFYSLGMPPEIVGIDIGIGASAIYPMLGCRLDPSWRFVGTEIDDVSSTSACMNIKNNNLDDRIQVIKVIQSDPLLKPFFEFPSKKFSFTICNPPFYSSVEEIDRSAEEKALEPSSICTGSETEMVTSGGEEYFVRRIVEESSESSIRGRCLWFTSMLGKFSSLISIVEYLRQKNVENYIITELVQGQTRRWVIGWSFSNVHVSDEIARRLPSVHHTLLPLPNTLKQTLPISCNLGLGALRTLVINVLSSIKRMSVEDVGPGPGGGGASGVTTIRASATANTWSRAARRKNQIDIDLNTTDEAIAALVADISFLEVTSNYSKKSWILACTWRLGRDRTLFESFWGHVTRKISAEIDGKLTKREVH